jgi:hypothetical protein
MGGPGSGSSYHWWRDTKTVVEDCLSLDTNRWTRDGILKPGQWQSGTWTWTYPSGNQFTVNYEVGAEDPESAGVRLFYCTQEQSLDYRVRLATTRPKFGGYRWWFVCPLIVNGVECNRRVRKLYLPPPSARYFGCRHCHGLTYTSCQESHKYDALYQEMAGSLGWDLKRVKEGMKLLARSGEDREDEEY